MTRKVGVQSYTYRTFTNQEIRDELDGTAVEAIELCDVHVDPFEPETGDEIRDLYEDAGVDVCGFGVHNFEDVEEVSPVLSFAADHLDVEYVSIHADPPQRDVLEELCAVAKSYDILLGVHNHGPGHVHDSLGDVLEALNEMPNRLGACVDTGHFLRSGVTPVDSIQAIGDRTHAIHLKDFTTENQEVVIGDGQLDVVELLQLLDRHTDLQQPLVIEYEEDPENPTPAVEKTIERVRTAEQSIERN